MTTTAAIARPTQPAWALVEVGPAGAGERFRVEPFSRARHLAPQGWTWPGVSLHTDPKEFAHLRDRIIN
jgi:hypothetical protein